MPNWVFNELTAEGPADSINKMVEQLNKPLVDNILAIGDLEFNSETEIKYSNPIFSFRNIIAPTDPEAYKKKPNHSDGTDNSWYSWNNRNWGVKWDVAVPDETEYPETTMDGPAENGNQLVVVYRFNTAWGIPDEALIKLSSQFDNILFTLHFDEETGWGGEYEYLNGEALGGADWNWHCVECDYPELGDPSDLYCEDCENYICPDCGFGSAGCDLHPLVMASPVVLEITNG